MQRTLNYKEKIIQEVFNLIKVRGLNNESRKFAVLTLIDALKLSKQRRMKHFFIRLKNFQVTSRLGYDLTQSVVIIFEILSSIQQRIQKECLITLRQYCDSKKLILDLHQPSSLPWYNDTRDTQIIFLNQKKIVATLKILALAKRINTLDWKKIRAFRKWQLEDLRNLMEGYRKTNCNLFLSMRNMYLCYVMKKVSYKMDGSLKEGFFRLKYQNEEGKYRNSKRLLKLNEILMKRSVITNVLQSEEFLKKKYLKQFLRNLENEINTQEKADNKLFDSVRIICFYWKRKLALAFRKFHLACSDDLKKQSSKKFFENRVQFNKAKVILEAKAELINNLFRVLEFAIHRKIRDGFNILLTDLNGIRAQKQLAIKNIVSLKIAIQEKDKIQPNDIKNILIQKLKPAKKTTKELNLIVSVMFKKIQTLYRKKMRIIWNNLYNYGIKFQEDVQPSEERAPIERNVIANQAIVGTYLEQRLKEMDETLHQERRKLGLRNLIVKKSIRNHEYMKSIFGRWRSTVEKWKLSFKLTILKKKEELESEKKHLSDVLDQLNKIISNDTKGLRLDDSQVIDDLFFDVQEFNRYPLQTLPQPVERLPEDPGLKYLEYIERQVKNNNLS